MKRNCYIKLIEDPGDVSSYLLLAKIFREEGDIKKSSRVLLKCIEVHEGHPESLFWLSHQMILEPGSVPLLQLEKSFRAGIPDSCDNRSYILFALAKVKEKICSYEESFFLYKYANQQRKEALGLVNTDAVLYVERADLVETVDRNVREVYHQKLCDDNGSDLLFVVGLPRCGSTLVETILSLAEGTEAKGESEYSRRAIRASSVLKKFSNKAIDLGSLNSSLNLFRKTYRSFVCKSSLVKIDKTLYNFYYLGIISLVWPEAKIVHVLRNPLDQIISSWTSRFAEGQTYSLELADLVKVQIAYQKLMHYWRDLLGNRMYNCNYEKLVKDPIKETKSLAKYCCLQWNEKMLNPQRSNRIIRTASFQQVRVPINDRSIGRWKNYYKELYPYLLTLQQANIEI